MLDLNTHALALVQYHAEDTAHPNSVKLIGNLPLIRSKLLAQPSGMEEPQRSAFVQSGSRPNSLRVTQVWGTRPRDNVSPSIDTATFVSRCNVPQANNRLLRALQSHSRVLTLA
jgi:hypothetical protein